MRTTLLLSAAALAATSVVASAAPIVIDGVSYRAAEDSGVYESTATSPDRMAYGLTGNANNREWFTFFAFDLDADDDGVNDLAGAIDVKLDVDFANAPGSGDDDFVFQFLSAQGPAADPNYGAGTNYPFNTLVTKPAQSFPGSGGATFEVGIDSGATAVQYDLDWLADVSVSTLDNVIFFGIRATPGAEVGAVRFSTAPTAITPTITAVIPEPASAAVGAMGLGLMLTRRRR
ncbi:MAG: hypothetical protein AAF561_00295 [Planctomycetota bacterium]